MNDNNPNDLHFLLLNAASSQLKAARSLRQMSAALSHLERQTSAACRQAHRVLNRNNFVLMRKMDGYRRQTRQVSDVLEGGSIEEMMALRDSLVAALASTCRYCGQSPPLDAPANGADNACWCGEISEHPHRQQ